MPDKTHSLVFDSPIGFLELHATDNALTAIRFMEAGDKDPTSSDSSPLLHKAKRQLEAYFAGNRQQFDIPLSPAGTEFEKEVWRELKSISFGGTITYLQLAKKLGDPNKVRAVGRANGQNPLPVIIPCHRVIGSNNKLTGYAGGIKRKQWLLQHEGALLL